MKRLLGFVLLSFSLVACGGEDTDSNEATTPDVMSPEAQEPESPQEPVGEPTAEPVQPAMEPVQPAMEPVQPAMEPVQPAMEPAQPVMEPAQPVMEPAQPVMEPAVEPEPEPPLADAFLQYQYTNSNGQGAQARWEGDDLTEVLCQEGGSGLTLRLRGPIMGTILQFDIPFFRQLSGAGPGTLSFLASSDGNNRPYLLRIASFCDENDPECGVIYELSNPDCFGEVLVEGNNVFFDVVCQESSLDIADQTLTVHTEFNLDTHCAPFPNPLISTCEPIDGMLNMVACNSIPSAACGDVEGCGGSGRCNAAGAECQGLEQLDCTSAVACTWGGGNVCRTFCEDGAVCVEQDPDPCAMHINEGACASGDQCAWLTPSCTVLQDAETFCFIEEDAEVCDEFVGCSWASSECADITQCSAFSNDRPACVASSNCRRGQ